MDLVWSFDPCQTFLSRIFDAGSIRGRSPHGINFGTVPLTMSMFLTIEAFTSSPKFVPLCTADLLTTFALLGILQTGLPIRVLWCSRVCADSFHLCRGGSSFL